MRGARPQRGARERGEGDEADEVVVLEHHAVRACDGRAGVVVVEGQVVVVELPWRCTRGTVNWA